MADCISTIQTDSINTCFKYTSHKYFHTLVLPYILSMKSNVYVLREVSVLHDDMHHACGTASTRLPKAHTGTDRNATQPLNVQTIYIPKQNPSF